MYKYLIILCVLLTIVIGDKHGHKEQHHHHHQHSNNNIHTLKMPTEDIKKIQIILGSTRPGRIGDQVGEYIKIVMQSNSPSSFDYEIVDLRDHPLPFFDEPEVPALKKYTKDHTLKWSEKIKQADAFVFVTPEYNGGIPGVLKNCIDFLYQEWKDKPTVIVSYAYKGGTSAASNLKTLTTRVGMKVVETMPALITDDQVRDPKTKRIINPETAFAQHKNSIEEATNQLINLMSSL